MSGSKNDGLPARPYAIRASHSRFPRRDYSSRSCRIDLFSAGTRSTLGVSHSLNRRAESADTSRSSLPQLSPDWLPRRMPPDREAQEDQVHQSGTGRVTRVATSKGTKVEEWWAFPGGPKVAGRAGGGRRGNR
ncbi:hypothetical protein N656DRAFT_454581 [Canariomyces notabilis]|uniref:Uncharacterized protein n=1 Tax=Canariomyces notabilis TaxID=2074819 RepID=A0AAN6QCY4_9PEZI|nr:hypothetical protein N656DRAFT_454581 [Canariomyces arenarius]